MSHCCNCLRANRQQLPDGCVGHALRHSHGPQAAPLLAHVARKLAAGAGGTRQVPATGPGMACMKERDCSATNRSMAARKLVHLTTPMLHLATGATMAGARSSPPERQLLKHQLLHLLGQRVPVAGRRWGT